MFDNLFYQDVVKLLASDIYTGMLPNSLLFSGPYGSGKLTAALELARILSCTGDGKVKGKWNCTCTSCQKHKALVSTNLLISGPKDCSLEIGASKDTFLKSVFENKSYKEAANYLFVRSVRKLTARFNPVFYNEDDKASKISPYIKNIDELLEELDPKNILDKSDGVVSVCNSLVCECEKLEKSFMYDSVPISHIRNASSWAHYSAVNGKKFFILENAERMNESSRNALLKILEEPPEDTLFILTTSRRGQVMPTILSRLRTYNFVERNQEQQSQVIEKIFRAGGNNVQDYLAEFLPIEKEKILDLSDKFLASINQALPLKIEEIVKQMNDFKPRIIFQFFLQNMLKNGKEKIKKEDFSKNDIFYAEKQQYLLKCINECYQDVMVYNQIPAASLEKLAGELI
ncbi:MAG: DNA polymerase III [Treponemataceae bacterium]